MTKQTSSKARERRPLTERDERRVVKLASLFPDDEAKGKRAVRWGRKALKQQRGLRSTHMIEGEDELSDAERDAIVGALGITTWAEPLKPKLGYGRKESRR